MAFNAIGCPGSLGYPTSPGCPNPNKSAPFIAPSAAHYDNSHFLFGSQLPELSVSRVIAFTPASTVLF
jgi:hypothetical protein